MKNTRFYPLLGFILVSFFTPFSYANPALKKSIPSLKTNPPLKVQKNAQGFWVNQEEEALKEALKLNKPILIDFFGIWCPPCNQLDELVFSSAEFKVAAQKFVLLKMDADREKSWVLKSKYKVTGYPTIIIAQTEEHQFGNVLERIVGFYPKNTMIAKMNEALNADGKSLQEKLIETAQKGYQQALDANDDKKALAYIQAALALEPENLNFKLNQISLQSQEDKSLLKAKESKKIFESILNRRQEMPVETLSTALELNPSQEVLDELISRVNPSTLYIDNQSLTEADIYSMGIDLDEKKYLPKTLESYEKLLKKYGENSRSVNLSYTHYLIQAKEYKKAQTVFDRMISLYPDEFTFYYAASSLGLETKDFDQARHSINQALKFSYGDLKLRSQEKALRIAMAEYKEKKEAEAKTRLKTSIEQSEIMINEFKINESLQIRTPGYIKKLKKTLAEAQTL